MTLEQKRAHARRWMKQWRAEVRARGLCAQCGDLSPKFWRCMACRAKEAARWRAKAYGPCSSCGQTKDERKFATCSTCRQKWRRLRAA